LKSKALNEDFILDKNIELVDEAIAELDFKINSELCFILISNLIQNAIRHNVKNGQITISIKDQALLISNTGSLEALNEVSILNVLKKIFKCKFYWLRFRIVKEIADANSIEVVYRYENNRHTFSLTQFKK
jgi:signal transduction histidine kinase